jgi:hypothetical protein
VFEAVAAVNDFAADPSPGKKMKSKHDLAATVNERIYSQHALQRENGATLGLRGRDPADPDLVAVGVMKEVLARFAVVLEFGWLDATPVDRLNGRVEVGDHDGDERAAGLRRILH